MYTHNMWCHVLTQDRRLIEFHLALRGPRREEDGGMGGGEGMIFKRILPPARGFRRAIRQHCQTSG
jgi:hypothetical protein